MVAKETKEPTPTEIMEEIKKSKDEVIKQAEKSRISIWLTVAIFGGSIGIVGVSLSIQHLYSVRIPILTVGLGLMIWALSMAKKRQQEFKTKWNEPPRF